MTHAYSGKHVIGFDVGGLKEIIVDGVNGFLVEPKNCTELANKILLLLTDRNLAVRLGRKARERVSYRGYCKKIWKSL